MIVSVIADEVLTVSRICASLSKSCCNKAISV